MYRRWRKKSSETEMSSRIRRYFLSTLSRFCGTWILFLLFVTSLYLLFRCYDLFLVLLNTIRIIGVSSDTIEGLKLWARVNNEIG